MQGTAPSARQTDFRRRTVLPSTLQNLRTTTSQTSALELTSDEYLDRVEEELNSVVDKETDSLVDGMRELVALARLDPARPPHPSASSHRALASQLRTEHMLRSAQSLLSLAHTLKLLHLFGDGQAGELAREKRDKELRDEIAQLKARARELAGHEVKLGGASAP
ncbi:uncharacterized protein JCM10292_005697 [Rhodotorula paludigena]|uniref:uncharacterized protein n=1 Tax=Rhodotorula paludigena TaxID=86838 RepID=UPI003177A388